jgi:hypothetical protein
VVTDTRVEMMYLKVGLAVSLFESEGTKLTFPVVQFAEENPNPRWNHLVALGYARKDDWTRLGLRPRGYAKQLIPRDGSRTHPRELRQQDELPVRLRVRLGDL